jgi:hypothetical protein
MSLVGEGVPVVFLAAVSDRTISTVAPGALRSHEVPARHVCGVDGGQRAAAQAGLKSDRFWDSIRREAASAEVVADP